MKGMRAKALGHGLLAKSEHGQASLPGTCSTVAVGLRRVTVSLGVMHSTAGAEEGADVSEDSFKEGLLAQRSAMLMENELEREQLVPTLGHALEEAGQEGMPRAPWLVLRTKGFGRAGRCFTEA